jgi:hypothetical protein
MFKRICAIPLLAFSLSSQAAVISLDFDQSQFVGEQGAEAQSAFLEAASFWETTLLDSVEIFIDINYTQLASTVIGSANSTRSYFNYSAVLDALAEDITSDEDATAVNATTCSSTAGVCQLAFMEDNGDGGEIDNDGTADNNVIAMTSANAKALGLEVDEGVDATITFNSDFAFDYDRSDGISSNMMDFVGVAIHEIGHVLGFISGVDIVDENPDLVLDPYAYVSTFDLFRYSDESASAGVIDMRSGVESFFSIDGGVTETAPLSTGRHTGDGQQASHFEDHGGEGIMDPTFSYGELGVVRDNDLLAFDVIGWDLISAEEDAGDVATEVSEPHTQVVLLSGLLGMFLMRRRKSAKTVKA